MLQIKPNRTHGTRTRNNEPAACHQLIRQPTGQAHIRHPTSDPSGQHPLVARYLTYTNTRTRISTYLQPQWLVPTHARSTARLLGYDLPAGSCDLFSSCSLLLRPANTVLAYCSFSRSDRLSHRCLHLHSVRALFRLLRIC